MPTSLRYTPRPAPIFSTVPALRRSVSLTGRQVYVLFYAEDNGLPAVLTTDFVAAATPEPAWLTLLGAALIGFGWIVRRRRLDA